MSYLVKSPIDKNVKFAHVYAQSNSSNITTAGSTINADVATNFSDIVASSGIGITLSAGNIILANKKYIIYNTPNVKVSSSPGATSIFMCYAKLFLNNSVIQDQIYAGNVDTDGTATNCNTRPVGFCSITANSGDVLSVKITINNKSGVSVNHITMGNATQSAHSIFLWEIDL